MCIANCFCFVVVVAVGPVVPVLVVKCASEFILNVVLFPLQLPFPVIGSLNAVHMFAANHGASLKSTTTSDAKIVWRDFHDR